MLVVHVYRGEGRGRQRWRWRAVSSNGEIVASGEGYVTRWNAKRAARKLFPEAAVRETRA